MILLTGVTGNLGAAALAHVRTKLDPSEFAVLARDPQKAQPLIDDGLNVRIADFDQPDTLPGAFEGIDTMLFVSTMAMDRGPQQRAVVDAAVAAGVNHIVYTGLSIRDISTSHTQMVMSSHFDTEDHIRNSGVNYTFLRNTMYAEAINDIVRPGIRDGVFALAGGEGRVPYALRPELGEAAANVVLSGDHVNATYELTGPEAWSYSDIAAEITRQGVAGSEVQYQPLDNDTYAQILAQTPLPPFMQQFTLDTVNDIADGQYDQTSSDLATLLGRQPAGLSEVISTVFAAPPR